MREKRLAHRKVLKMRTGHRRLEMRERTYFLRALSAICHRRGEEDELVVSQKVRTVLSLLVA